MNAEQIISRIALIEYTQEQIDQEEWLEMFISLLKILKVMPSDEQKRLKSIYWKLSFRVQKELGFQSKRETLESGSKKDIRKKTYKEE